MVEETMNKPKVKVSADGSKHWYLNGKRHSKTEFNEKMKNRSLKEHFKRFL